MLTIPHRTHTLINPHQAKTPEARAAAVEAGFSRVVHSVDWAARHRFMTDRELRRWDRLVAWKAHDASECRVGGCLVCWQGVVAALSRTAMH